MRPAVQLDERVETELLVGATGDAVMKLSKKCDLLLIAGTSLKSDHMTRVVKENARIVRKAGGAVVLIDRAPINMRKWNSHIDFHLQVDIESCAERLLAAMDVVS